MKRLKHMEHFLFSFLCPPFSVVIWDMMFEHWLIIALDITCVKMQLDKLQIDVKFDNLSIDGTNRGKPFTNDISGSLGYWIKIKM